jgi:MoxR-like ATPase
VPKKLIREIKRFISSHNDGDRAKPAAAGNFCREPTFVERPDLQGGQRARVAVSIYGTAARCPRVGVAARTRGQNCATPHPITIAVPGNFATLRLIGFANANALEAGAGHATTRTIMRFEGTSAYVATDDLKVAVNAAIALERPLLVKGEPGTGKTVLALEIAKSLDAPLMEWHIKSTTKALQGLYEYDAVSRLRDSQLGDARVADIRNYIKRGRLWDAFVSDPRPVLLIDEIDKADIEFPNDLLQELDRMEFFVYETGETIRARRRPIVIITSNNEKELPDAFLRRCFFHYIRFPDPDTMRAIVEVHFPAIKQRLVSEALALFYEVRAVPGLKKKPSTSELLDWLKLLMVEDIGPETLRERDPKKLIPPLHGALIKNEQDVHLFERLAFMARRERR